MNRDGAGHHLRFLRRVIISLLLLWCWCGTIICPSGAAEPPEPPTAPSASSPVIMDQLSSVLASVVPVVSQILSPSAEGGAGVPGAAPGGGALGALYDFGRKAAGALSTSLASDETRETVWVPLHEQLGLMRDFLGLPADDAQGVRSAARLLVASQLPLLRFASEREACKDPEADLKALKLVTEYPAAKKMLSDYMDQRPDRNLRAAPADLAAIYAETKEYLKALRGAGGGQVLPVSILGGLDTLSNEAATKINGYFATVARYFTYTERFARNKKGLVFFAKHVLPRILQLFALQLDGCRYLWRFLADVSPPPRSGVVGGTFDGSAELPSSSTATIPLYEADGTGALGVIAQNLGFKTPSTPYAHARAFGRRLLARVQVQIGALYSLSRGCLAATSLSFQRQYAEAQDKVELGETPAAAFLPLREQSEQLATGKASAEDAEAAKAERQRKANPRLRALTRGEGKKSRKEKASEKEKEDMLTAAATTPPGLSDMVFVAPATGDGLSPEDEAHQADMARAATANPKKEQPRKDRGINEGENN